jgi:hypothetical protein
MYMSQSQPEDYPMAVAMIELGAFLSLDLQSTADGIARVAGLDEHQNFAVMVARGLAFRSGHDPYPELARVMTHLKHAARWNTEPEPHFTAIQALEELATRAAALIRTLQVQADRHQLTVPRREPMLITDPRSATLATARIARRLGISSDTLLREIFQDSNGTRARTVNQTFGPTTVRQLRQYHPTSQLQQVMKPHADHPTLRAVR